MSTESTGTIKTWKVDKGFGFITPDEGGNEVFFHITQLVHSRERVAERVRVRYTLAYDEQRRPQAVRIRIEQEPLTPIILTAFTVGIFFLLLIGAVVMIQLSPWIIAPYVVFSIAAFFVYRHDKAMATRNAWRVSEDALHTLEFLGGWPGALLAQTIYHHKTNKSSYQAYYWFIIAVHLALLIVYGAFVVLT